MNSNSNEKPSSLTMTVELVGIMVVLLFGVVFVFILSTKVLSTEEAVNVLVWPLLFGIIGGTLVGFLLLNPKEWADTETKLRKIQLITLGTLFFVMLGPFLDIKPEIVLQSLSFIMGIAFGAIMIVVVRSLIRIQDWNQVEKEKEKNDTKDSFQAN
jgi:uncharacterized protein involved in response to NO